MSYSDMPPRQESLSDEIVVKRVLQGDKQAYAVLVNRYKNLVYRLALSSLKNWEMSEDAAQEAFLSAYKNLGRLENPSSFGSWIYAITNNVCRNMKRKIKHTAVSLDDLSEHIIAKSTNDNDSRYVREILEALGKIITKLPSKYREVIELRYTEGFTCKKIAAFLGLTERAVINRLYYARKMILKQFRKEGMA